MEPLDNGMVSTAGTLHKENDSMAKDCKVGPPAVIDLVIGSYRFLSLVVNPA